METVEVIGFLPSSDRTINQCVRGHLVSLALILGLWILGCVGCDFSSNPSSGKQPEKTATAEVEGQEKATSSDIGPEQIAALEPAARQFCGDCHSMPKATSFPKSGWFHEVERGLDFYITSGRNDLKVPRMIDVQRYFRALAPERLAFPQPKPVDSELVAQFDRKSLAAPSELPSSVAVSFVGRGKIRDNQPDYLTVSDMRSGAVMLVSLDPKQFFQTKIIATLSNPSRIEVVDWNQDGRNDLIVADLGTFLPGDHKLGRVMLLEQTDREELEFRPNVLLSDRGRIADVKVADFDKDGDQDLVVADFGWHTTGGLVWLERTESDPSGHTLTSHPIDPRPGTIDALPVDLNGDGRIDIVSVLSQEYEHVEVYLQGDGVKLERELLYNAEDPAYGSSGIELADMDQDKDLDIVFTNGDSFDSFFVKPYHSIQWLENEGNLKFQHHPVALMPGVHRAVPLDLEGDGDVDLVAAAFLPKHLTSSPDTGQLESLIALERGADGTFAKRVLEAGRAIHPALHISDLDGDSTLDLVVPNFWESQTERGDLLEVWFRRDSKKP